MKPVATAIGNTKPDGRWRCWSRRLAVAAVLLYLLLLIPSADPPRPEGAGKIPFAWNQPEVWAALESDFERARTENCDQLSVSIDSQLKRIDGALEDLSPGRLPPNAVALSLLESNFFRLASDVAACPEALPRFIDTFSRMRTLVKDASSNWELNSASARNRLYRLLYGGRAVLEEIMLQMPNHAFPAWIGGVDEPSRTPAAMLMNQRIHSGDILVSRGTSPNSALIARSNDYPGNFSHVALVHVDETTGTPSVIEAHIEHGVAVATTEQYLRDPKFRILILRLRRDHPLLRDNPRLPHEAATWILERALTEHIPYDFAMDYEDPSRVFCSEVASVAYREFGVTLWTGHSFLSGPGVTSWMAAFGVRQFETQKPTDLEYDPQLRVVAEWRDPNALFQDHLDNAVVDVMLEHADRGEKLDYPRLLLPVARLAKAYSALLNLFGAAGPIPEGMSATAALRNQQFIGNHRALKTDVSQAAESFRQTNGYVPPYPRLITLTRSVDAGRPK